jgi:hypothetical protein
MMHPVILPLCKFGDALFAVINDEAFPVPILHNETAVRFVEILDAEFDEFG